MKQSGILRVLARQTLLLVGTFALIRLFSVGTTLFLSRRWGPEVYGDFFTLSSVAVLVSVVLNGGLEQYLVRELVQRAAAGDLLLGDVLLLKAAVTGAGALVLLALAALGLRLAVVAAGAYALGYSALLLGFAACRGINRISLQALLQIVHAALLAGGTWLLARAGMGATAVLWLALAVSLLALLWLAAALRHQLAVRWHWRPALTSHLRPALAIGLSAIVLLVLDRLLLTSLAGLHPRAVAGWFGAGYNLVQLWNALPALAMSVALPMLARAAADPSALRRLALQLLGLGVAGACLAALGLAALAPTIVRLLYGSAYAPAVPLLRGLAWSLPASTGLLVVINVLNAARQQAVCVRVLGAMLPLAVLLIWGGTAVSPLWGVGAYALVQWLIFVLLAHRALLRAPAPAVALPSAPAR